MKNLPHICLSFLFCLSGSLALSQLTVDADQLKDGISDNIIEDMATSLVNATEQAVIQGTYFNEILEPYRSLGIDPNNPAFANAGREFYNAYSEARTKDLDEGGNTHVSKLLKDRFKSTAMGMLDEDSQKIITDMTGLVQDAQSEIQKITDAMDHIGKAVEDDPNTDISDMLAQYGLKGDWADRFREYEGAWSKIKNQYSDHYEAFQIINKAMGQNRPGPKVLALFQLGEKFGDKIPVIGRLVTPMFTLGKAMLDASGALGKLLERNFNQGCVGQVTYNSTDNPYVNERARLFNIKFPNVEKACVVSAGMQAGIYADIYENAEDKTLLYFFHNGQWIEGNPSDQHKGLADIRGLIVWLRNNGYQEKAGDLKFIIDAYNLEPGYTVFRETTKEKIGEAASMIREIAYRLRLCPEDDVENLIMNQGSGQFFYTLLDPGGNIGWDDLKDFSGFYENEALEKMIYYRYVRSSRDNRYRFDNMISAMSKTWPVEIDGKVLNQDNEPVSGAVINVTGFTSLFNTQGDCKMMTSNANGVFRFYFLLEKDARVQVTLEASKEDKSSGPETFPVYAKTDKSIDVLLTIEEDDEAAKKEVIDALEGLLGKGNRLVDDIDGLCNSVRSILSTAASDLQFLQQEITMTQNEIATLRSQLKALNATSENIENKYKAFNDASVRLIEIEKQIEQLSLEVCQKLELLDQADDLDTKKQILADMQTYGPRLKNQLQAARNEMTNAQNAANAAIGMNNTLSDQMSVIDIVLRKLDYPDEVSSSIEKVDGMIAEISSLISQLEGVRNDAGGWLAKGMELSSDSEFIQRIESLYSAISNLANPDPTCLSDLNRQSDQVRGTISTLRNAIDNLNDDIDKVNRERQDARSRAIAAGQIIDGLPDDLSVPQIYMDQARDLAIQGALCITMAEDLVEQASKVQVPNVIGMSTNAALILLAENDLGGVLGEEEIADTQEKANKVIDQSPGSGVTADVGSTVTLRYYGEFDTDALVANTECQPGAHPQWSEQDNQVMCYCDEGLVWNSGNTACVDPQTLVDQADCSQRPGSYAAWNSVNQRVECWCPEGKKWNDTQTACIDDIDYILANTTCHPGAHPEWNVQLNKVQCFCDEGLVWNSGNTACVDPQTLVDQADCSQRPGSYAAWNSVNQRVECWCPEGKKWNDTQTACIDDIDHIVANTNCWPGSHAEWNAQLNQVQCYCDPGLVWNKDKTACVNPQDLVNQADCSSYPGSYAAWNNQNQRVECWCPDGKKWNDTQTACIDDLSQVNCWPGSYAAVNTQTGQVECYCNTGLVWNSSNTACIDPQELVNQADCSSYPGSYAAWNSQNQRVECWCQQGKVWNSTMTACIDDVSNVQCWPGSYAAFNPQTQRIECFCNEGLVWNDTNTACIQPQGGGGQEETIDEIVVTQQNVTISVWDHGCEDGDIITLKINGTPYLSGYTLSNAKKSFNVTLPVGTNLLELIAVDSGTDCPPQSDKSKTWNSAAIHITHASKGGNQTWKLKQGAVSKANFIVNP